MSPHSKNFRSRFKPTVSPKQSKPIQKTKSNNWLLIWLCLTGVAMLSATAGALLAVSLSTNPFQQTELSEAEQSVFNQEETLSQDSLKIPQLNRPVNILVLGVKVLTSDLDDSSPHPDLGYHALVNSFEGLSDTMLLLRFDPQQHKMTVLSIPRDTQTEIRGRLAKINHANLYGGPALAAETVGELLGGIKIDRYVRVNVQGVEKLIDALGGVEVYVPKDMKYTDESQHLYIDLKQGEQVLDGDKAMQFLRYRYDNYGDISRVQRQQMLMRALVEQTLKPTTIVRIPEILDIIKSHLDTNLSVKELIALSGFGSKTSREDVQMIMLPGDFSGQESKASYWLPHRRQIQQLSAQYFDHYPDEYSVRELNNRSSLRVAIQDSTENPEAVQSLIDYLREAGYERIYVSRELTQPLQQTRVVAQGGDRRSATALQQTLGVGEVLVESTGELNSDVTIQLGTDWQGNLYQAEPEFSSIDYDR